MSSPDLEPDRLSLSRHHPSDRQLSPSRRAHRESRPVEDLNPTHIHSPTRRVSRHRKNFNKTRTLTGAFQAASRGPTLSEEGAYGAGTPNSRTRKMSIQSPASNPPDELRDIYRQIDDEDSLTDLEGPEDAEIPVENGHESRPMRASSGSGLGEDEDGNRDVLGGFDANLLDGVTDPALRRRLAGHSNDEQRLKRATASHSPVFSRARVGKEDLASENLQRHEDEVQHLSDDVGSVGPSLNLPSSWGSRATRSRDWMRNIRTDEEFRKERNESTDAFSPRPKPTVDSSVRPVSASDRSPGRSSYLSRNALGGRTFGSRPRSMSPRQSPVRKNQQPAEDDTPNTPKLGYKSSTFNKPSPTKRDSHSLLRKLSRAPSPDQVQSYEANEAKTPEPQKQPESRIYDKTPVVTGAWIDTPVTERPAQFPEHLTNGLSSADTKDDEPAKHVEPEKPSQQDEPSQRDAPKPENPRLGPQPAKAKTRPPPIKPTLPKSGLETVMEDVKADKDSYAVGDDTIESLQELLDGPSIEPKAEEEENAESVKAIPEKLESAKPDEEDTTGRGWPDDKLHSLAQNINEVRKGLSYLENCILPSRVSPSTEDKKTRHIHIGESCATCGAYSDGRVYAAIPFPRLWKLDPASRHIRPTRLGWFVLISAVWFLSESTMCDYYCHPIISNVCEGNCLMRNAPQFPFVIPTTLWRWTNLSAILTPLSTILIALFRFIAQLLGLWDGYVDDAPRSLNLSGEIRIRGSRVSNFPAATSASGQNYFPKNLWQARAQPHSHPPSTVERDIPSVPELNLDDDASMDEDEYIM